MRTRLVAVAVATALIAPTAAVLPAPSLTPAVAHAATAVDAELRAAEAELAAARESYNRAKAALAPADVDTRRRERFEADQEYRRAESELRAATSNLQGIDAGIAQQSAAMVSWNKQLAQARNDAEAYRNGVTLAELRLEKAKKQQPYSRQDLERLVSQGVVEMINEYRQANGLHPLVTHEVYNVQAENWSRKMRAENHFRHSDGSVWGHSGESIINPHALGSGPSMKDPNDPASWRDAARILFEGWQDSPPHNAGMLSNRPQGVGVGVSLAPDGRMWATTMFFNDRTYLTDGAFYEIDGMTKRAKASGSPFYVARGANQTLNSTKPRSYRSPTPYGAEPIVMRGHDKSRGVGTGMDPRITREDLSAYRAEVARREAELQKAKVQAHSAEQAIAGPLYYASKAQEERDLLQRARPAAQERLNAATAQHRKATAGLEAATSALEAAQRGDTAALQRNVETAAAAVAAAEQRVAAAKQAVNAQQPPASNGNTTQNGPADGGSSASEAVGIIIGVLAALAALISILQQFLP